MGPLERLVREMFDTVINEGNVDKIIDYVVPDWVSHTPQGTMGVNAFKDYVRAWRSGFPDIQCDVYDVVESGDAIAWRVRARGTHVGEFMGMPGTNRFVDFDSMNFARARDGKPFEHTVLMDVGGMMAQLGLPLGPTGAGELIRAAYDAFGRADLLRVMSMFDPHILWQTQPSVPVLGGRYEGLEAVGQFFGKLPDIYSEFRVEPDRFIESGDDVIVLGHLSGAIAVSGETFELPFAHFWTTHDGLATSFTEYTDSAGLAALLSVVPRQEIRLDEAARTTQR